MEPISRIIISGDRFFARPDLNPEQAQLDADLFAKAMDLWITKHGLPLTLIEGCARGVDHHAGHVWAPNITGIHVKHFPAKWNEHNSYDQECWCNKANPAPTCKGAGPMRNQAMIDYGHPQAVIAFHRNLAASKGTKDMVKRAQQAGIPVWVPIPQPQGELPL